MRAIGIAAVVAAVVGGFGYMQGWFDPKVELNVSPDAKQQVETFTQDTIDSAQEHTNKAFDSLKKKLDSKTGK